MTPLCCVCHRPLTPRQPGELLYLDARRREVRCHFGRCMAKYNDEPLPQPLEIAEAR